jgi:hypothetical protein
MQDKNNLQVADIILKWIDTYIDNKKLANQHSSRELRRGANASLVKPASQPKTPAARARQ